MENKNTICTNNNSIEVITYPLLIPIGHKCPDEVDQCLIWCSKNFYLNEFAHQKIYSYCHPSHEIQLQLVRTTCTTNQEVHIKMTSDILFLPM